MIAHEQPDLYLLAETICKASPLPTVRYWADLMLQNHLSVTSTWTLQSLLWLQCVEGSYTRAQAPRRHYFDSSQISKQGLHMPRLLFCSSVLHKCMGKPGDYKNSTSQNYAQHKRKKTVKKLQQCYHNSAIVCLHAQEGRNKSLSVTYLGLYLNTAWKASNNNRLRR